MYMSRESCQIKGRQLFTEKLPKSVELSKFVWLEQECQESLIQEKIHDQQNLNEGLKYLQS